MITSQQLPHRNRIKVCTGLLLLCALALEPARSAAQETPEQADARDQEARRLFEAGRQAYVEQRYQDALSYFEQSHQLSQRPQLLFNIGQAADRLGQRERAVQAFRDYLAAVPDATNRADIERRITELEAPATYSASTDGGVIVDSGQPTGRDGIYLRGALGFGGFSDSFSVNLGDIKATASGATFALEIAAGLAIKRGLALAGFVAAEWAQTRQIKSGSIAIDNESVGALLMVGAMGDWYFDPTKGWHAQAGLALSRMEVTGGDGGIVDHVAVGGALIVGGGYEWKVGDKLAIGALARLTLTQLQADNVTHNFVAGSLLASLTMF